MVFPPQEQDGVGAQDLRAYLNALRRRLPLIAVIALSCTALAALRSFNLPSVYASTSRVQLAKEAPDPTQSKYMMYWDGVQQQYLNTQIKVFGSQTLGLEVIRAHPEIAKELEVEFGTDDPDHLALAFSSGVRVKSVSDTYLVDVGYESLHADRCARYANALAQAYIGQLAALWGRKTQVAAEKIGEQAQVLYQKLGQSEAALRSFLKENESPLFESQRQLFESRTTRLDGDIANVQRQKNRLAADLEAIKLVLKIGDPLIGRMLHYDALGQRFTDLKVAANPRCTYCAEGADFPGYVDYEGFCKQP